MKNLLKHSLCLLAVLALSVPAAAQVDLSRFVVVGASFDSGFLDNCWVKHGQTDSYPAIIARQAGMDFQQPILDEPGVGGCMILQNLAPTFTYAASTPKPLNATLAKPYNNLAVPGFWASDVVTFKPKTQPPATAPSKEQLGWLTLRGLSGGTSALEQAASLKPTFTLVGVLGNEILGAATSGTVIDGVTLPPTALFSASYKAIIDGLKASQGGVAAGIVMNLPYELTGSAYFTAVKPYVGVNPATGAPIYVLGPKGCPAGVPACPVPAGTLVPLPMSTLMKTGYGIPCAVAPYPNCNKPLPDNGDAATGMPGLLYPDEVALIRSRGAEFNAAIKSIAEAAGYKVFDYYGFQADIMAAGGKSYGGLTLTHDYLSGGICSYDGVHWTSVGWAMLADEVIQFINYAYGASIHRVDMSPFLFNANSLGYRPVVAPSQSDIQNFSAAYWTDENLKAYAQTFWPHAGRTVVPVEGDAPVPGAHPVRMER